VEIKNLLYQINELKSKLSENQGDSQKNMFNLNSEIAGLKEKVKDLTMELKTTKEEKERLVNSLLKEISDLKKLTENETGALSKVNDSFN
jgi:peptidoglycan hydrolase CwlO-like protein